MLHRDKAWLCRVFELMMRASHTRQNPAICFEIMDELPAVHGGYDNHRARKMQERSRDTELGSTRDPWSNIACSRRLRLSRRLQSEVKDFQVDKGKRRARRVAAEATVNQK